MVTISQNLLQWVNEGRLPFDIEEVYFQVVKPYSTFVSFVVYVDSEGNIDSYLSEVLPDDVREMAEEFKAWRTVEEL